VPLAFRGITAKNVSLSLQPTWVRLSVIALLSSKEKEGYWLSQQNLCRMSSTLRMQNPDIDALFTGQELTYIDPKIPQQKIGTTICRKLGTENWDSVDPGLRNHYRKVSQAKATAKATAVQFNLACTSITSNFSMRKHSPAFNVRVPQALVADIEGGGGCYFVEDVTTDVTRGALDPPNPEVTTFLDAFTHFSVCQKNLVIATKVFVNGEEVACLEVMAYKGFAE